MMLFRTARQPLSTLWQRQEDSTAPSIIQPVRVDLGGLTWLQQDPTTGLYPSVEEGGGQPPEEAVDAAREGLISGVMCVTGHGLESSLISNVVSHSQEFFDRPAQEKFPFSIDRMVCMAFLPTTQLIINRLCDTHQLTVCICICNCFCFCLFVFFFNFARKDRSRGWELYPHHLRFASRWTEACRTSKPSFLPTDGEPSSRDGILCERFVVGAPGLCDDSSDDDQASVHSNQWRSVWSGDPFYSSPFGRVFYELNRWPSLTVPLLRPTSTALYNKMLGVSVAMARVIAAALDLPSGSFDRLLFDPQGHQNAPIRHHSRLQINNYPSQLRPPRGLFAPRLPLRANTHLDTSLFTLLARDIPADVRHGCGSSGALEVCVCTEAAQRTPRWMCVDSPNKHDLTLQFGSLIEYFTNGRVRGVTHRVSNPPLTVAANSRRTSIAFVLKPDYSVPARPLPGLEPASDLLPDDHFPTVGLVGRVGWQNHAMIFDGLSRETAVQSFKRWKLDARKSIGLQAKSYRTL